MDVLKRGRCQHADQFGARITFGAGALDLVPQNPSQRPPRTPFEQTEPDPPVDDKNGMAVVKHDLEMAAGTNHADKFADCLFGVRCVVQNAK